MRYEGHDLLDQLAGQYVLGTLRGRARRRFERVLENNPDARAAVHRWEDRFVGMLKHVKPEAPSKEVWLAIERRLGLTQSTSSSLFGSIRHWVGARWTVLAVASVAVLAIAVAIMMQRSAPPLSEIAVIEQAECGTLWHVRAAANSESLVIDATSCVKIDAAHAYELWALPASGAAPVSLGLLPTRGHATLALSTAQRSALSGANKIAVSLEPPRGSPTGAPTGPIIHVVAVAT